ncbi:MULTISPECIES: monovalent cation/H+ antiporter subunit D [Idiomarina]|jgi:multicomponent K+:H+ antiporter subunit D|uniref:Monovalent cation/H+ antiporter subunit D n=2 Tax=Idiomarina baltica TaxID=190892 RepID=A0A348WKY4_9GAMM|nr:MULTISPECIES: monovalent cation/H+ antiporter subunit D [Idiomarina]MAD53405.1 monovalent cation/H+ antiporter subunit D [Idiomarinaceae bacterium]MEC7643224.1 monovalent cation/H+ antiporter subunit D [Pseudomonadota bacterium]HBY41759.1 monovalent cation/H+ antiporter subunit D [Alteromonas sp.]EAQ30985.1 NADH dehydrogenase subunit N [Idiomarina baltica OS145]MAF76080.1 monovalent cation/H+ antiporter subunit D [Idiomarinaceae bacterium]|tara:strand:+ start:2842 stop:4374 length:1533 start_codon:yes stop_codon:yes gene_type:complete
MWQQHLAILPILIPLFTALLQLLPWGDRPQPKRRALGLASSILTLVCAALLLVHVNQNGMLVYALGDWSAPFGIVLVLDKLSTLMILLTAVLALPVLIYGCYTEDNLGSHFHALFQFQVMGIIGAFATGDLFNLFVFFEVLLISSYGLMMHGGGKFRVRSTLHYVLLNLLGSALFLISVGTLYATTGTLNMADMAVKVAQLSGDEAALARAGGFMLLAVFGIKAAILPLHFWLPQAYSTTTGVVAALFAIMTKVGVYSIIRVYTLIFGPEANELVWLAADWLWILGILTLIFGIIGMLGTRDFRLLVAYLVIVSVGTLLATYSFSSAAGISTALFYLIHSTVITGALFLLADVMAFERGKTASRIVTGKRMANHNTYAVMFLIAAIAIIGLPPLSGFAGKLMILQAAPVSTSGFWLWGTMLLATLVMLIMMSRTGSKMIWHTLQGKPNEQSAPIGKRVAIGMLLSLSLILTIFANPIRDYTDSVADELLDTQSYPTTVIAPSSGEENQYE